MILKRILKVCCVALFGCLIICLLTAPFVFNQNNQVGQHKIVCADSSTPNWSFQSSNFGVPMILINSTTWNDSLNYSNIVASYFGTSEFFFGSDFIGFNFWYGTNGSSLAYYNTSTVNFGTWQNFTMNVSSNAFHCSYLINSGFNFDIKYVYIFNGSYRQNNDLQCVNFRFYDSNGVYLVFQLLSYSLSVTNNFTLTDRTYYFTNSLTDNEAYQAGVQYGTEQGLASNQQDIFDRGFSAGKLQGDDEGYRRGVNEANQYNFFNLMGAVMDAPVKAFIGLFNFNFLGVNLLNIASGIVTFAVVVRIVRLVLGGR